MRKNRLKGVAVVVAIMALAAAMATAATAAEYKSESKSGSTYLKGQSEGGHAFSMGFNFVCTAAEVKAQFPGSSATTITTSEVNYKGCTVSGQLLTFSSNGCSLVLSEPTGGPQYSINPVAIQCPPGQEMVFNLKTSGCSLSIPPQTPSGTSTAINNSGVPKTVTTAFNISKLKYNSTGGYCGGGGLATYTGKLRLSAFTDSALSKATGLSIG